MEPTRPTILPYDPGWPAAFEAEATRLHAALENPAMRIHHHGSTLSAGYPRGL
jgi:GrpB-like predicted nucleotidyltransferase (UPF0157 family)